MWEDVYKIVKDIPKGKVMTYGRIARILGIKDVRKVGWALHANKSGDVPCHRVVNKEGRLAKNFAFNGEVEQQNRLELEGLVFKKNFYVDLDKYGVQ